MNSQHMEDFEPDLYEEFSNQDDEKISNINSKCLNVIEDNLNSTKSDKKVMFVNEDDNEYEPIDRTVGDDSQKHGCRLKFSLLISKCMFIFSLSFILYFTYGPF